MYLEGLAKIFRQLCPVKHAFFFFVLEDSNGQLYTPKAKKCEKSDGAILKTIQINAFSLKINMFGGGWCQFPVSPVTGHRCSIPRASYYCEQCPRRTLSKFNSMVLIQFLRSLVRISAVWKSLIRAFKQYRGREENTKSDWERMVWTFECRFVNQVFVWWTGCSRPVTSDSSKADFVKPSQNLLF